MLKALFRNPPMEDVDIQSASKGLKIIKFLNFPANPERTAKEHPIR